VTREEKKKLISTRSDWFHSLDVGDGLVTPGVVSVEYEQHLLKVLQIPDSLAGLRVLDIGTQDGFWAFECERRGASEVVAIDVNPIDCHCFKVARELLDSKVKYHHMSVYEMDEEVLGGKFDLVLFPGVFYHLRHIIMSFDNIWKILKPEGIVLVETHVCDNYFVLGDGKITTLKDIDYRLLNVPLFRFYRKNELNPVDWSNWFGGNVAAVLDVMWSAGFTAEHLASWQPSGRAAFRGVKNPATPREWELGSYEGSSFQYNQDGTWTWTWHDPRLAQFEKGSDTKKWAPRIGRRDYPSVERTQSGAEQRRDSELPKTKEDAIAEMVVQLQHTASERDEAQADLRKTRDSLAAAEDSLTRMRNSVSWRVTEPARRLMNTLRSGPRKEMPRRAK